MPPSRIRATIEIDDPKEGDAVVLACTKLAMSTAQQARTEEKLDVVETVAVEPPAIQSADKKVDLTPTSSNVHVCTDGGNVTLLLDRHDVAVAGNAEKSTIQSGVKCSVVKIRIAENKEILQALKTLKVIIPRLQISRLDQRLGAEYVSRAQKEITSAPQPDKHYVAKMLSNCVKTIMEAGKVAGVFNDLKQVFETTAKWCGEHGQEILNLIPFK
jgi:hypothetical protein